MASGHTNDGQILQFTQNIQDLPQRVDKLTIICAAA